MFSKLVQGTGIFAGFGQSARKKFNHQYFHLFRVCFYLPHMDHEESIGFATGKMKIKS
jgi:hypothetical protein